MLIKRAYQEGLMYLKQLVDLEGNFLEAHILVHMFGLTLIQVNSLISAIPKAWKMELKKESSLVMESEATNYETVLSKHKIVSFIYSQLNESQGPLRQQWYRWNVINPIDFDQFCEAIANIKKVTNNAKLRSFQYRLLNSTIILNKELFRWNVKKTNKCTFCLSQVETINHFFYECEHVVELWNQVKGICTEIDSKAECRITKDMILYNAVNDDPAHLFNFLILIGKQYMYAQRCLSKPIRFADLWQRIMMYRNYELYSAKVNKLKIHCKKWCINNYNGTGLSENYVQQIINNDQ